MPKGASIVPYFVGVFLFMAVGFVVSLAFIFVMKALGQGGRGMDGLALVASIIMYPVFGAGIGLIGWAPAMLYFEGRGRPLSPARSAIYFAAAAFLVALIFAGPAGFKTHGGAPLLNYCFAAIGGLGAFAATWVRGKMGG